MIYEIRTYNAVCDGCEKVFSEESNYGSDEQLKAGMMLMDWLLLPPKEAEGNSRCFCPDCITKEVKSTHGDQSRKSHHPQSNKVKQGKTTES